MTEPRANTASLTILLVCGAIALILLVLSLTTGLAWWMPVLVIAATLRCGLTYGRERRRSGGASGDA